MSRRKALELVPADDPVLRQVATPVQKITSVHKRMAAAMAEFLRKSNNGVGLAAPQVGIPKRIIAIKPNGGIVLIINPVLSELSERKEVGIEGCLSLPGIQVPVARAASCRVTGTFTDGQPLEFEAEGMLARICQHEVDHLEGVLITDHGDPINAVHDSTTGG